MAARRPIFRPFVELVARDRAQLAASDRPRLPGAGGRLGLYVLDGRLRLVIGEHDLLLTSGEAAGFDTRVPHWFGSAGSDPVEFLSLFGRQGERIHVRARPKAD